MSEPIKFLPITPIEEAHESINNVSLKFNEEVEKILEKLEQEMKEQAH